MEGGGSIWAWEPSDGCMWRVVKGEKRKGWERREKGCEDLKGCEGREGEGSPNWQPQAMFRGNHTVCGSNLI